MITKLPKTSATRIIEQLLHTSFKKVRLYGKRGCLLYFITKKQFMDTISHIGSSSPSCNAPVRKENGNSYTLIKNATDSESCTLI